jgi:hypothetical protein
MHSDTQEFVRVAGCIETLTAGTWKTRSGLEVGIAYSTIRSAEASFAWSRLRYGFSEDSCAFLATPLTTHAVEVTVRSGSERCDFIQQNIGVQNGVSGQVWLANHVDSVYMAAWGATKQALLRTLLELPHSIKSLVVQ